jgi:hypothetical protein
MYIMFFKGLFSKVSNVAKMDFDDKREQAIYNLGVDAGERQSAMNDTIYQLGTVLASFAVYKTVDYGIKKLIKNNQEKIIEDYMKGMD